MREPSGVDPSTVEPVADRFRPNPIPNPAPVADRCYNNDRFPPAPHPQAGTGRRPVLHSHASVPAPDRRDLHPPSLRRLDHVWIKNPVYFLTACVAHRAPILATPTAHEILRDEWSSATTRHGWQIGRYVVMPDHVHFFACPLPASKPLPVFLHAWKQWTAKRILSALGRPAPLWQPRTFDHVLRQRESYAEKWTYVQQNPVRAGLALTAEGWPYAGHIHFDLPPAM